MLTYFILNILILLIFSGKLAAFTVLCEQYQPSLRRDPSYSDYLAKIGQLFFGVAVPRPRAPGLIGNIFLNNIKISTFYT